MSVLSTPHNTSASGVPAVSSAFETSVPVSPPKLTMTSMPVSLVNDVKISGSGVNASYANNLIVPPDSIVLSPEEQEPNAIDAIRIAGIILRFMGFLLLVVGQ